jgi:hypothetical protein
MSNFTHTPLEIQIHRIEKFLHTVFQPDDVIELRGLGAATGTMGLFTTNYNLAARTAIRMSANGADVYFTLNPLAPNPRRVLDKPSRRISSTTRDSDIAVRNLYLIDCDSKRPKGTAATLEHRAAALALAQMVQAYLNERGWPAPIMLDSGNGVHLLFSADRCTPEGDILALALKHLAKTLNTDGAEVDTCVHNAARISRVPYILNKKAARESSIISYPKTFDPVNAGKIYGLAVEGGMKTGVTAARPRNGVNLDPDFDVEDLLAAFPDQLISDGVQTHGDTTFYALARCPFVGREHTGQQVGAGKTCITLRPDGVGFHCFSANCADHTFVDLLNLLYEQTGRRFSGQIWADNLEELAKRFPCTWEDDGKPIWLNDPTQLTRNIAPAHTVEEYIEDDEIEQPKKSEEIKVKEYETIPAKTSTLYAIFQYATRKADHDVAHINPAAQRAYRKEVERILRSKDYRRMIEIMGQPMIDEIDVEVLMSATPPVFEDPDGNPTCAGLDVLIHADDIPLNMRIYTHAQAVAQYEREQGTDFPTTQ